MAQKITHYDIGDLWTPQATFTVNSTATDPTTIIVRQQDSAGTETVLYTGATAGLTPSTTPVAKVSTGVYKLNPGISLTASGYWFVKFEGTAGVVATEQQQAIVDPDEFTSNAGLSSRALVGLAETKDWLKQQNIDTSDDLELVRCINDVSDRIHQEAGREFKVDGTNPQTRSFIVSDYTTCIEVGDLTSLSTSSATTVTGVDWTTTVYTFAIADVRGLPLVKQSWEPYTKIEVKASAGFFMPGMAVNVTGTFGFPSVPGNIRQAALDTIAATMDRDVEHYRQDLGTVTPGGEAGNLVVMSGGPPMLLSLPPGAFAAVRSYKRAFVG